MGSLRTSPKWEASLPEGLPSIEPARSGMVLGSVMRLVEIIRSYRSRETMKARELGKSGAMQNLS